MSIQVPPFPGANQFISLQQAITMTTDYRKNNQSILDPDKRDQGILPLSESFNREVFDTLLSQPGCEGIRFYYGMDDKLKVHIIAVGVDAMNQDMLPPEGRDLSDIAAIIENSIRCPTGCPPESVLNS